MKVKKFGRMDFKKLHPAGSLGAQLRTVEDIMLTGNKIPFINENLDMKKGLQILSRKKLGFLLIQDKKKQTKGIITDGQIRRFNEKKESLYNLSAKEIMTINPISIDKDSLAVKALGLMNEKKITSLCIPVNSDILVEFIFNASSADDLPTKNSGTSKYGSDLEFNLKPFSKSAELYTFKTSCCAAASDNCFS